jgi:hypothetical protein
MIPVKIQCGCGQKYAFEVEAAGGRMPAPVACPICGTDGTEAANMVIAQSAPAQSTRLAIAGGSSLRTAAPAVHLTASAPSRAAAPRGPVSSAPEINHAQLEHEARAKISWGDSQEDVVKHLMIGGMTYADATILIKPMFAERAKAIRFKGIKKIFLGIALMCVPIVMVLVMLSLGVIQFYLFAVSVMIGLFGAWQVLKGIIMMVAPKSEPGDVAED